MAKTPKLPKVQRVQIGLAAVELKAIDDWRFANHAPSRAEAIRRLMDLGMRAGMQEGLSDDQAGEL